MNKNVKIDHSGDCNSKLLKLETLLEMYKTFKDSAEKTKKNIFDTYRLYIPTLFGILIVATKVKYIVELLKLLGIETWLIVIVIGFLIIVSLGQIIYDLSYVIIVGTYLAFLEIKINELIEEDIAFWECKFGEALRLLEPTNISERITKYLFLVVGPAIIMTIWFVAMYIIFGLTPMSISSTVVFCLIVVGLIWIIGIRRISKSKRFIEDNKFLRWKCLDENHFI